MSENNIEVVGWQCRCACEECVGAEWGNCSEHDYEAAMDDPEMQARELVAMTDAQAIIAQRDARIEELLTHLAAYEKSRVFWTDMAIRLCREKPFAGTPPSWIDKLATSSHPRIVEAQAVAVSEVAALIEEQAREIERLDMNYNEACADAMDVARELAALKAKPSGVVLPERHNRKEAFECGGVAQEQFVTGWNACLDEVARLNPPTVSAGEFEPDSICEESDGCPTENAVLKRFWREQQAASAPNHSEQVRDCCRVAKVDAEGVQFGNAWFSHERITGYNAEQLNSGNCRVTGRAYMDWLAAALNAGSAAPDGYVLASKQTLSRAAYNIAYAIFNLADRTLEGLKPGVIESTDPATSGLIAERDIRAMLAAAPTAKKEG